MVKLHKIGYCVTNHEICYTLINILLVGYPLWVFFFIHLPSFYTFADLCKRMKVITRCSTSRCSPFVVRNNGQQVCCRTVVCKKPVFVKHLSMVVSICVQYYKFMLQSVCVVIFTVNLKKKKKKKEEVTKIRGKKKRKTCFFFYFSIVFCTNKPGRQCQR